MPDTREIVELIENEQVAFFCGSGISYASGLASASEITHATARAFLPRTEDAQARDTLLERIQPEVLYEFLLEIEGDRSGVLDVWRCLDGSVTKARPALEHYFVCKYSHAAGVPVFTTNFDTLLESAAEALGIPFQVLGPRDEPPIEAASERLLICKLHGTVGSEGELSAQTIMTTITEISRTNLPWLAFLSELMERSHLCFIGYSGRDIDYYPHIRTAAAQSDSAGGRRTKRLAWINRFTEDDHSARRASASQALQAEAYPSDLFAKHFSELRRAIEKLPLPDRDATRSVGQRFLAETSANNERDLSLHHDERAAFLFELEKRAGLQQGTDRVTEREILLLADRLWKRGTPRSRRLALTLMISTSNSIYTTGRIRASRRLSKTAAARAKKAGADFNHYRINALSSYSYSFAMEIPFDPAFKPRGRIKDIPRMAYALVHLSVTIWRARRLAKHAGLPPRAEHQVIEIWIKLLSLLQTPAPIHAPWIGPPLAWAFRIAGRSIREQSAAAGYGTGIANALKFLGRLPTPERADLASDVYQLMRDETGNALIHRNQAEQNLRENQWDGAQEAYRRSWDAAKRDGNGLNELKAISGLVFAREQETGRFHVEPNERERVESLLEIQIDSPLWTSLYRGIFKI